MLVEGGVVAAIAGKAVAQQMRVGRDIRLRKGAEFGPGRAGNTAIRTSPAKKPCCRLTACPCLPVLFFGAGTFSTAATTRLLSGCWCCGRTGRIAAATDEGLVRLEQAAQRMTGSSLSPWRSLCAMVDAV